MSTGLIAFTILVAITSAAFFFAVRHERQTSLQRRKRERETSKLALEFHPQYQQKVAADRQYHLQRERQTAELQLKQAEFALKRYMALHYVPPETYLVDADIDRMIPLPSLKALPRSSAEERANKTDSTDLQVPMPFDLASALHSFRPSPNGIYLGRSATPDGYTDVIVPLNKLWHVALTGPTGGGKTNILLLIVSQLLSDTIGAEVYLADPHYAPMRWTDNGEMIDWRPVEARLTHSPLYDTGTIAEMLQEMAYGELARRMERNRNGEPIGKSVYIGMDEFPVIAAEQPDATIAVGKLLRQGRQFRMYVISSTQDMLLKTIGGNSGIRECYRTGFYTGGDATTARAILDLPQGQKADVEGLGDRGLVYLKTAISSAQVVRVPFASNEATYRLLGGPAPISPTVQEPFTDVRPTFTSSTVQENVNAYERATEADVQAVRYWHCERNLNKEQTILNVWNCTKGGSKDYKEASAKYDSIVAKASANQERQSAS